MDFIYFLQNAAPGLSHRRISGHLSLPQGRARGGRFQNQRAALSDRPLPYPSAYCPAWFLITSST